MNTKIEKEYIYYGLGFPIKVKNVKMFKINNEWHPKIDVKSIADTEIKKLIPQKTRLTGNQIKFIRSYFNMSLRSFAKVINETHSAIKKWEDCGDNITKMDSNIEIMIRLHIFARLFKNTDQDKLKFYEYYKIITEALYHHRLKKMPHDEGQGGISDKGNC